MDRRPPTDGLASCSAVGEMLRLRGKIVLLGVLDLSTSDVESPGVVADRIRRALPYVPAERLVVAPDCGMKYLTRDVAIAKLVAMVRGAESSSSSARRMSLQESKIPLSHYKAVFDADKQTT